MKKTLIEVKERIKTGIEIEYVTKLKLAALIRKSRFLYKHVTGKEVLVTAVAKIPGVINLDGDEKIFVKGQPFSIVEIKQNNLVLSTILYIKESV